MRTTTAWAAIVAACASATGLAQTVTFQRVIGQGDAIPGGPSTFLTFSSPALSDGNIAFRGSRNVAPIWDGIYAVLNGTPTRIADIATASPASGTPFNGFSNFPDISDDEVAFSALAPNNGLGVYRYRNGGLSTVASTLTPIPGAPAGSQFGNFTAAFIDGDRIAFAAIEFCLGRAGVYSADAGNALSILADTDTIPPGRATPFSGFGIECAGLALGGASVAGDATAFLGRGEPEFVGLYTTMGGTLTEVAARLGAMPGGDQFDAFGDPAQTDTSVFFNAFGSTRRGVFQWKNGALSTVADLDTPVPGVPGRTFGFIGGVAVPTVVAASGDNVAFAAADNLFQNSGVYARIDGRLVRVLAAGDQINGQTVTLATLGPNALDDNQLALAVFFSSGNRALYIATIETCIPDVTTTGTSNGIPDGAVDISDYSFYLTLWAAGDSAADVTTTGTSNGLPDGAVDISDFSYYLTLWAAGCP